MGWPDQTPTLKQWYPTSTMVTGYDIIFFWVARMMFMSMEFMKEIPFKYVFIHGLVRDSQGRKDVQISRQRHRSAGKSSKSTAQMRSASPW